MNDLGIEKVFFSFSGVMLFTIPSSAICLDITSVTLCLTLGE